MKSPPPCDVCGLRMEQLDPRSRFIELATGKFVCTHTLPSLETPEYWRDASGELWWCNTHERRATYMCRQTNLRPYHRCDPKLGGILLPCSAVNLTGIAEIEDEAP